MDHFKTVDYKLSQEIFHKATITGRRLTIGEMKTSQWLQKNHINMGLIKDISRDYPDLRVFIIGEGETEGFYIYSQKKETCFKFEAIIPEQK
ncbi:MAG: hypothetical protein AB2L24_00450 [Mangrovibacterium sp.]